jgi:hypothetical protein
MKTIFCPFAALLLGSGSCSGSVGGATLRPDRAGGVPARYIVGLAFLFPGVVSPDLPHAFAHPCGLWGHRCSGACVGFTAIAAKCGWHCRRMDFQYLGLSRSSERFLPG